MRFLFSSSSAAAILFLAAREPGRQVLRRPGRTGGFIALADLAATVP
jgi:hypothetical protein